MADDIRLVPTQCVEHATGVADFACHCEWPFRHRRSEPSLLVPGDVVLLCELVSEIAEVFEAQSGPAVHQENRWSTAGAEARDERAVVSRRYSYTRRKTQPHPCRGTFPNAGPRESAQRVVCENY